MKLSIIIPVYNVKDYLYECIDSVICQNDADIEIILIDDGSTDGSGEICDEYACEDSRIKVFHQNNEGLSSARNVGIRQAAGDYLCFLDSDDFYEKDCLGAIIKELSSQKSLDVLIGFYQFLYKTGDKSEVLSPFLEEKKNHGISGVDAATTLYFYFRFTPVACQFFVNRNFLISNKIFFYEGIFHEDEEWIPRLLLKADVVDFYSVPFYNYRLNRVDSITSKLNPKREDDKATIISLLIDESSSEQYSLKAKTILYARCAVLWFSILSNYIEFNEDERIKIKKLLAMHRGVLKTARKMKYHIFYYMSYFPGLIICSKIYRRYMDSKK